MNATRHRLRIANAEVAAECLNHVFFQPCIKRRARPSDVRDAIAVAHQHCRKKNPRAFAMHAISQNILCFVADDVRAVEGDGKLVTG